ncbi:MAG TPA: PIN domain-containing protein [Candidatus Limnocylindrales bacterium]|nr:PIN domain-containing protein [Candidatus Limnocylindrales bacterium]
MAGVGDLPSQRRLILDAGGILAWADGNGDARATIERARLGGYAIVIPSVVVAQVHRGGPDQARTDRIFKAVDAIVPTSVEIARRAGELLAAAGLADAVDAIVVAEALAAAPAIILTSDRPDIRRLLEGQAGAPLVAVVEV